MSSAILHSIATVSLSGTLDAKLQAIAQAGFGGVEIFEIDLPTYTGTARAVGDLMRSLNLKCTVFQRRSGTLKACRTNCAQRTFDRMKRKFDNLHGRTRH